MEREADILAQYRIISAKLKKRFMKKPNVAAGSEQYASLAKTLKTQECPQYAGFCCLAQARCEQDLGNSPGEAQALTEAARNFLSAEWQNKELLCPSYQEHLMAAVNCYSHAIRVHLESKQPALAASVCLELGNTLRKQQRLGEAIQHYQRAAELQAQNPPECLKAMEKMAVCKIDTKDYEGALAVVTEMSYMAQDWGGRGADGRPVGMYTDTLAHCEVTRVLLLMVLQPTPQRIRPEHAQMLEKYTWDSRDETAIVHCLTEDVYLFLQSVVMACQSRDLEALRSLQVELWPLLTVEQNHLLHLVIEAIQYPPGEGL